MTRWTFARLAVLVVPFACGGCTTAAYSAPAPPAVPPTVPPPPAPLDDGALERIQALEAQCRARLSGETAEASMRALDRAHEMLGAGCDLTTVDHDPLHWMLRCRTDALFASGSYALAGGRRACPELGGVFVSPWECVGAVLAGLSRGAGGAATQERKPAPSDGALERLELAVVGHVDLQPISASSDTHVCTALQQAFHYAPELPWEPVSESAEEEERLYANNQLAWCRAASVAERLRAGMQRARLAADLPARLAVVGAGASWLRSREAGRCPSHGEGHETRPECPAARRVDVLVRLSPRASARASSCDRTAGDAESALYCLERCLEQAAVGAQPASGVASTGAPSSPLFEEGAPVDETLPGGWYVRVEGALAGDSRGAALDLRRVCRTLGIADDHC